MSKLDVMAGRSFHLLAYTVTHTRLFLRSTGSVNVDLQFCGVEYISLPTDLGCIRLVKTTAEDLAEIRCGYPEAVEEKCFVWESGERRYFIVASVMHLDASEGDKMPVDYEWEDRWEEYQPTPEERKSLRDSLLSPPPTRLYWDYH